MSEYNKFAKTYDIEYTRYFSVECDYVTQTPTVEFILKTKDADSQISRTLHGEMIFGAKQ